MTDSCRAHTTRSYVWHLAPQAKCDNDVTDLFAALDGLLHDVDAQGVCSVFDFCPQAEGR